MEIEAQIGILLQAQGWKLAVAESCTGGLVSHRITNIPGASEYYQGSITAYAYYAKETLLGVQHETLVDHGAVSEETVLEMARGVRQALNTEVGLSVSGIAGPGGGLPQKPVGTVWIGLSTPRGDSARVNHFSGDRVEVKDQSAQAALEFLLQALRG